MYPCITLDRDECLDVKERPPFRIVEEHLRLHQPHHDLPTINLHRALYERLLK
jgi:hypothetical protein